MPNIPRTQHRSIRVDDALWESARTVAEREGMDRASVVRQFLRWYVGEPGAELPNRPAESGDHER